MYRAINDLPDELLAAIFEELERAERGARDMIPPRPEWEQPRGISYLRLPTRNKFNVTSVSHRWFSIASSTPRLWDELYIDIDWDAVTLANALQQTLNRSKNLPLTVSITNLTTQPFTQTGPIAYGEWNIRQTGKLLSIKGLFATLAPISPRISSLAFGISRPSDGYDLLSRWTSPLPTVQVVSIEAIWLEKDDICLELPLRFLSCIRAPSIIHITNFQEMTWILEDSHTLPFTKIWMNGLGLTSNLLALVKLCNNLDSLQLFNLDDFHEDSWIYEELTFASVREIHIDTCSSNFVQQLVQACPFPTFPNVTHLTVYDALYPLVQGFHQVFAYNFPSLQELSVYLDTTEEHEEHALFLCNLPPQLQVLRFVGLFVDGFIAYLLQQPAYLSDLRVLWLYGCFGSKPEDIEELEALMEVRDLDVTVYDSDGEDKSV